MKILNLYIGRNLLATTLMSLGILVFVMLAGHLVQALLFTAKGMSAAVLGEYLLYMIPNILCYVLPVAVLCSTILEFSRMSADGEITAMKANGISLWQIISPALLLAVLFSALCLYLQCFVKAQCNLAAEQLKSRVNLVEPLKLLDTGRIIEIEGASSQTYFCYIGSRQGDLFKDIHVSILNADGSLARTISAKSGTIVEGKEGSRIFDLHDVVITMATGGEVNAKNGGQVTMGGGESLIRFTGGSARLPLLQPEGKAVTALLIKPKFLTLPGLITRINLLNSVTIAGRKATGVTPYYVELYKRLSLGLSPIAFVFLGIPFGIRSRRSDASVGIIAAFILAGGFYIFLVMADALKANSPIPPQPLIWLPNLLYQIGGIIALRRVEQR
jgi:lipopolysaccharide export system permease protein